MSDVNFVHESDVGYRSTAMKYGLIGGLVSAGVGLITYLLDMADPSNNTLNTVLSLAVFLGAVIFAIKEHRDSELNGFISFKRAFGVSFLTTAIMALIGAIWTYVFVAFIAPDMIDTIMDAQMQGMAEGGMDEDQIEQAMSASKPFMTPPMMAVFGFLGSLVMGAIIDLIVSAVMKKENPEFA